MKVLPFKIPKPEQDALIFQIDQGDTFYEKLHQHEEIQISLIVDGSGTLVVGDSVNDYTKNDVLIIGSHIPHVFKSDNNASKNFHMLSLFFTRDSFGSFFFDLEELKELHGFFKRAKHGFKVTSKLKQIKILFFQLEKETKLDRFLTLLKILKLTSKSNYKSLSSFIYDKTYTDNEGQRMRNVFEYTMNNFQKEISLDVIANIANMTKNAFCKYFKKRTNKTFVKFLNELRVEYACRLLQSDNDLPVVEIADQVGFNNMSNFNRQFKTIKNCNPSEFKKTPY
ncbi:helix-turn-helix transcriptional regulator [uncultured Algibacter sp.]|uniref:AraC family transcriptional regulator n=1 Tax=uncultured Algibacter sp. TaxID=298659 RepID=UPI0026298A84|nr:helix-turn-helix transcriptional regulator [uncultured Algibacter sp.]